MTTIYKTYEERRADPDRAFGDGTYEIYPEEVDPRQCPQCKHTFTPSWVVEERICKDCEDDSMYYIQRDADRHDLGVNGMIILYEQLAQDEEHPEDSYEYWENYEQQMKEQAAVA